MKPKKDKYLKYYGGKYRIYNVYCSHCNKKLFVYQKDGWKGAFKRCYFNRILSTVDFIGVGDDITCRYCNNLFGRIMWHKKTKREAIRLFAAEVYRRRYAKK